MQTTNVTFEDREIEKLKKIKGNLSWHDFIIEAADAYRTVKEGVN